MVSIEEMKVGFLVWWEYNGDKVGAWSCLCIVTSVGDDSFKVKSLDNFQESEKLRLSDEGPDGSSRRNMKACTLNEVQRYFKRRLREHEDEISVAKRNPSDLKEEKVSYEREAEAFLNNYI